MKHLKSLLAVCFLFGLFSTQLFASGWGTMSRAELYEVLCGVNAEWRKKPELANTVWSPFHDYSEQNILRTHLMLVESYLREHAPLDLDPIQIQRRNHHLDVLHEYWLAGQFPNNPEFSIRTPYFIGENGNFCAVGYVMWQDGQHEIVKLIEHEINNAYVREIPYPELGVWAAENGFEVDELAWIQPAYSGSNEYMESFWVEHRGGNVWRIWLNASGTCIGTNSSNVLQDTAGFVIAPVGCTSAGPVGITPWTIEKHYNDYSGINYSSVVCTTASPEIGKVIRAYKDFEFSATGCTQWKVSKSGGPRFAWGALANQNAGGTIWIGYSTIDLSVPNAAPRFSHSLPLTVRMKQGGFAKYFVGGIDDDGDSLSYHLDTCRTAAGTPSPYFTVGPYPPASPLAPFGTDFPVSLNAVTGELKIETNLSGTPFYRRGALLVRVDEHRNGTRINSSYREVLMDVSWANPFQNPKLEDPTNISGGAWNNVGRYLTTCIGDTLSFHVMLTDSAMDSTLLVKDQFPLGGSLKNVANGLLADTILDAVAEGIVQFVPTQEGWYEFPLVGFAHRGQIMNSTSRSYRVKVGQAPVPLVQQSLLSCSNAEVEVGGLAGYTNWSWSGDYVQSTNDSVLVIHYPSPGTYAYQIVATAPNGCPAVAQGQIIVPNVGQPEYTVTTSTLACRELGLSLVPISGGMSGWSYQWSGDASLASNPGANSANLTQVYPSGGLFNWTVSVTDSNGCEVVQSGLANVLDDSPGFQANIVQNGCSPIVSFQSMPDNPALPFLVEWSGGGGINGNPGRYATSFTHTFPGPGNYPIQVTYTSSTGCDSTAILNLVIPTLQPTIWTIGDTLYTNAAASYQWYRDSMAIPGATNVAYSPSTAGYYSVYITDSMGCSGLSDPIYFGLSSLLTGIDLGIKVYPVPVKDDFMVELSDKLIESWNWELWSIQGTKVLEGNVLNQNFERIDARICSSGLYLLKIWSIGGVSVVKVDVQKGN